MRWRRVARFDGHLMPGWGVVHVEPARADAVIGFVA